MHIECVVGKVIIGTRLGYSSGLQIFLKWARGLK